ncbi:uncharacterized protein PHALS_01478 [Plasmopara halstedii]|uniref:Uncharacterized protein n=1 Tax=Plasmopara halstedii TaxID=4781 RepID=A0A0P1AVD2_PLAHL|nr:uncharacterized protein PHALS_01478 [Plasmopara halstedii]CEG45161.1 hypothetical protein PHALS_01478 [Plasmopara halstedii]|eukprot:XP_024581530.1 hypothetical protein PHALS_01478 [Plasmopara halstedii]
MNVILLVSFIANRALVDSALNLVNSSVQADPHPMQEVGGMETNALLAVKEPTEKVEEGDERMRLSAFPMGIARNMPSQTMHDIVNEALLVEISTIDAARQIHVQPSTLNVMASTSKSDTILQGQLKYVLHGTLHNLITEKAASIMAKPETNSFYEVNSGATGSNNDLPEIVEIVDLCVNTGFQNELVHIFTRGMNSNIDLIRKIGNQLRDRFMVKMWQLKVSVASVEQYLKGKHGILEQENIKLLVDYFGLFKSFGPQLDQTASWLPLYVMEAKVFASIRTVIALDKPKLNRIVPLERWKQFLPQRDLKLSNAGCIRKYVLGKGPFRFEHLEDKLPAYIYYCDLTAEKRSDGTMDTYGLKQLLDSGYFGKVSLVDYVIPYLLIPHSPIAQRLIIGQLDIYWTNKEHPAVVEAFMTPLADKMDSFSILALQCYLYQYKRITHSIFRRFSTDVGSPIAFQITG